MKTWKSAYHKYRGGGNVLGLFTKD